MGLKCSESFVYLKFGGILIFFFLPLGFPCSGSWHLVLGLWKIENKFEGREFEEVFMLESLSTCFCSARLGAESVIPEPVFKLFSSLLSGFNPLVHFCLKMYFLRFGGGRGLWAWVTAS